LQVEGRLLVLLNAKSVEGYHSNPQMQKKSSWIVFERHPLIDMVTKWGYYSICQSSSAYSAGERGGNNLNGCKDVRTENGSSQGPNLAHVFQVRSTAAEPSTCGRHFFFFFIALQPRVQ